MKIKDFIFKNLGIRQTVLKNAVWLSLSEATNGLLSLVLVIFAVRLLGVIEYGKFTFAFAFVSMVAILSDLGIMNIATREFSRNPNDKKFSEFLFLDLILSVVFILFIIVGTFFVTQSQPMQRMIFVLAAFTLISSFFGIFYAFFRSMQKMEYEAIAKIIQVVIFFVVTLSALYYFRSAPGFAYGYTLSNLIFMILFVLFFHFFFHPIKISWNKDVLKLLKISWPLSLGFTSTWIYINVGAISLGYFNLIAENGLYGAASKLALLVVLPAVLLFRSFYPALSDFFVNSKEKLIKTWNYLLMSMILFAVPIGIGGVVTAPKIIELFYGQAFLPAVFVFQFLIIVMAITLIGYPYNLALVISDNQKKHFFIILSGIILNIILNIFFIYLYGLLGLVISITVSVLFVFLLTIIVLKYFTDIKIPLFNSLLMKNTLKTLIAGMVMLFVINVPFINNLNVLNIILIGAITYSLCIFFLFKLYNFRGLLK